MKVTVLITYYNKGPFVEEAIRSVLSGTYTDFELLVVDDGSTDDGLERIRSIADPRIRILGSAVNTGRAAAANRGFEAARGEYIAVLDADDRMLPDRLERQVAFMDARPEVGVSGGYLRTFGDDPHVLKVPEHDAEAKALALFGMPVYYGTCIIRRSLLIEYDLRCDPHWRKPGMDQVFMLRVAMHTRFANLPVVLTEYRRGQQNMRHGRDAWTDRLAIAAELFKVLGIPTQQGDARLHCALDGHSPDPLDAATIAAIHAWKVKVQHLDREYGWFDHRVFDAELARRWDHLYHELPDQDPRAAWTHAMLSRPLPLARLRYLLLMRVKRAFGSVEQKNG